jgi:elongation factor G
MEVERAVRVLDGAVAILDAVSGVQAQTETVWAQADRYKVPRIAYINKMDRDGASLHHAVAAMEARLGCYPIIMQIPIGVSRSFQGAVDLVTMETISWSDHDHGLHITREPLDSSNARIWELAQEARANMIDKISQIDDEFVEYCLSDAADAANPPPDVIRAAVRRSTLALKAVPVFVGSSLRNKGVHPIMDAVIDFLPSPEEKAIVESVDEEGILKPIKCDPKGPLVAQAFKVRIRECYLCNFICADDHLLEWSGRA